MYDIYKPFRNYARQFPLVESLQCLWAYSEHVANKLTLPPQMQFRGQFGHASADPYQIYPWEIDQLTREIILNAGPSGKRSLGTWQEFSTAINMLRKLDDAISGRYGSPDTILRDLNRVVHQQFPWQRPPSTRSIMRAYKIFGTSEMRDILEETTGIALDHYFRLGLACGGHLLREPSLNTLQDYSAFGVSREVGAAFFDRLTYPIERLREATIAEQRYDGNWPYTFNPLRARPFVQFDPVHPERVLCPIPTFLMRRFSDGLFYDVSGNRKFGQAFGVAFEAYIGAVLKEVLDQHFTIRAGQEYRVGKDRKDGVDWIVSDSTGHLFIECKTRRLRQDAKFISDNGGLEAGLDAMAGFIVQHYRNIEEALAGKTDWQPDGRPIFPLIVTLEDWWVFSPPVVEILRSRVVARLDLAGIARCVLNRMPYALASADEFESAMLISSKTGLAAYFGLKQSESHRDTSLTAFAPNQFPKELRETHKQLFAKEWKGLALQKPCRDG